MRYLSVLFVFLLLISCKKTEIQDESPVIMSIGSAFLTENDVLAAVGLNATPEQKINYIQNWSDRELVYQAALEDGFEENKEVKEKIEDMKKNYLSIQYIQHEIGKTDDIEVLPEEIQEEFEQNIQEYNRKEPVVRVAKIVTATRMEAWKAREGLTAENFRVRGNYLSLEKILPLNDIKFAPKSDFNPETFVVIFGSRISSITLPIAEDGKYSIYLILAKENAGSQSLLDEVIDDVKRNVITKKQNKIIRDVYDNLRNRYDYSYDREYIANLEAQNKKAEETIKQEQSEQN